MAVVDLTHTLSADMPVYPGSEPPELRTAATLERDGFAEKWIGLSSHTGTHIDAPAHMLPGAPTLDQLGVDRFFGTGRVLDVSALAGAEIGVEFLERRQAALEGGEFVLFHTGWSSRWGQASYFSGFPVLAPEAARWLCRRGLKGIGFDAVSVDPVDTRDYPIHFICFRAGLILVENLTGLEPLVGRDFLFSCLPLKLERADGSPVRAIAVVQP